MENETIKTLADLSAIVIAAMALLYVARAVFSRSKSDTDTIKVFVDILSITFKEFQKSIDTHDEESIARHTEQLKAFRDDMELTRQLIAAFTNSEERTNKSIQGLSDNVGEHIRKVDEVGGNIMEKVTPLDQVLKQIHAELQLLRKSVDNHLSDSTQFHDDVINKTEKMENRISQVEKRITQEIPAVKSDDSKPIQTPIATKKEEDTTE